jgi:Holliday junction resolvasome RuvABC endonuclease subunit
MVAQAQDPNKSDFCVVGIDQALRNVGFCCNKNGELTAFAVRELKTRGAERLDCLRRRILMCVELYSPQLIALEGYSFNSTNRSFDLGEIGGVLKQAFYERRIPLIAVPPKLLKKFVSNDGNASKEKMIREVAARYEFSTKDDNIADAVGLAKFCEVFLTGRSKYRCELDSIQILREMAQPKERKTFKSVPSL